MTALLPLWARPVSTATVPLDWLLSHMPPGGLPVAYPSKSSQKMVLAQGSTVPPVPPFAPWPPELAELLAGESPPCPPPLDELKAP
ncbi:MAG: hypothetical protein QM820_32880 [Minicystis sp.]